MGYDKLHFDRRSHQHNCGDEPTAPAFFDNQPGDEWQCPTCYKTFEYFGGRNGKGWYYFYDDAKRTWLDKLKLRLGL